MSYPCCLTTSSRETWIHHSLNYRAPAEFARQANYGKDVGSAHFENAKGISNFPTATAAAG